MTKLLVNLSSFILKASLKHKIQKILQSEKIQKVHTSELIALRVEDRSTRTKNNLKLDRK